MHYKSTVNYLTYYYANPYMCNQGCIYLLTAVSVLKPNHNKKVLKVSFSVVQNNLYLDTNTELQTMKLLTKPIDFTKHTYLLISRTSNNARLIISVGALSFFGVITLSPPVRNPTEE